MGKINKIIILPGNGCTITENSNWYLFMKNQLNSYINKENKNISVILPKKMPDPY